MIGLARRRRDVRRARIHQLWQEHLADAQVDRTDLGAMRATLADFIDRYRVSRGDAEWLVNR